MAEDHNTQASLSHPGAGTTAIDKTERQSNPSRHQNPKPSYTSSNARRIHPAGPGLNRPNHPTLNNEFPRNTPSSLPQRPQFSLAGDFGQAAHNQSYIDPRYYDYNPKYRNPRNAPVWGLAKPLPRVVRPGMRRDDRGTRGKDGVVENGTRDKDVVVENKSAEVDAPGSAEAIPQLGMIEEQRQQEGKDPIGHPTRNKEERGYGHQSRRTEDKQYVSKWTADLAGRVASQNSVVDRYGTPKDERSNPMEEWRFPTSIPDPFDDVKGDLGEGRLGRPSASWKTTNNSPSVYDDKDAHYVDLEAGDNSDDWPMEDAEAEQYMREEDEMHNSWAAIRARFREPLAECLATMIAILIGLSTNLSVQTSNNTKGTYVSDNWAWGLGITIGIYIAGGISGGHLNPAVSLMLCIYRGFPLRKAGIYVTAQLLGALIAGLLAYGIYKDAILAFNSSGGTTGADGGPKSPVDLYGGGTGISFYTQPADFTGAGAAFANEFLATAILSCAILALGDDSNAPPGAGMHAFIVGLLVTALTMAFGYNTGACLNPARDFGPRLATAMVGYGGSVFTVRDAWWIYGAWGATITGALVGGGIYDIAIFVGGESPVNYPRGKRRRAAKKVKEGTRKRWWAFKKDVQTGAKRNHSDA